MRRVLSVVLVLIMLTATGCATLSNGVAPSSTPIAGKEYTVVGDTSGSGWGAYLFGGIPISEGNPTAKARDRATTQANADGLINCSVDTKIYNLMFLVLQRTQVSGDAIKFN